MTSSPPTPPITPAAPRNAKATGVLLLGAVVLVQLLLLAGLWERLRAHSERAAVQGQMATVQPGDPLPDFAVQLAGGETISRAALLERAPVLIFVASAGCAACEERRGQLLRALQDKHLDSVTVLVLGDGTSAWLREFVRGTQWLPALDTGAHAGRKFANGLVPFFALVNRTGTIQAASLAGLDHSFLHAVADSVLDDASQHDTTSTPHTTQEGG